MHALLGSLFKKRHPQRMSPWAQITLLVRTAIMYWKAKLDLKVITKCLTWPLRDLSSSQRQWDYYRDTVPDLIPIVMLWRLFSTDNT